MALIIGDNATTGTVNFSRGFGGELESLINQLLSSSGVIDAREASLGNDLDDLDTDQDNLDRRIESYEERISAQFIAMEAIVRSLNDSRSFLESTLENLLNGGRDS